MPGVEVFAEITCPFTHAGLRAFVDERRRRNASGAVVVRAWPLELVNGRPLDPDNVAAEVDAMRTTVAPNLFNKFRRDTFPRTSLPAFGLAAAAYRHGDDIGEQVSLALRWALFEEGRDIADAAVLREIGARFGVDPLPANATEAAVRDDWEAGRALGAVGSPSFFVDNRIWFCPLLEVRHVDGAYEVSVDERAQREFLAAALG